MTAIIGVEDRGIAYVGADSSSVVGDQAVLVMRSPKVFRNGEYVIGFSYTFRFGNILQYLWSPPTPPERIEQSPELFERFMVRELGPSIRAAVDEGHSLIEKEGGYEVGLAIIGVRGRIWHYERDQGILCYADGVATTGSGYNLLTASYRTIQIVKPKMPTQDKVLTALHVTADSMAGGVRGPFRVLDTNGGQYDGD